MIWINLIEVEKLCLIRNELIIRGLLWGNGIGLAILGIQYFFEVIQLNPETYYVNVMPVYITFTQWFLLNLGTGASVSEQAFQKCEDACR